ncbi:Predicted dehydrogenase [Nocardioides alpinus]|uniref:Gfo/Idh/MocA family oxidoreductase n=1 Tax=Nocardioides alpinus TaxID=748909 RepID=A0A1I1A913_9ACTN|nr:Gfo/Idh/MocA family oxidoreductase [Nocardioides alpinus]PKH43420.1 gfo/Idh/MocA family oxidoreductase [Nocardioides alpinus]SFB34479.1 Predicted dehydrogenase [Nocardioides alpinus]
MTTRWGVAGTGGMAEAFLDDFAVVPDAELVAIGSRTLERAEAFASPRGVVGMTYADVVAADLDVLYIATPHPQHRDLALAAIAHGTPVLVEKAFTATLDGAREVVAAAREAGVFCMEAMWTRLQPAVATARELVAAGEIGEVTSVHADLGAHRRYDPTHRLFAPELGGGAVLDLGVYPISFAQHFLGTPDRVTTSGTLFPNGTDATASLLLSYDDGRGAALSTSLQAATGVRATIIGTRGSIELGPEFHHPTRLVLRREGDPAQEIDAPALGRGYSHEIIHVGECLAEGRTESPLVPLDDTLGVQWVMQEALEQLGITPVEGTVDLS